jgi:transcriptional regulator with XRE-family HTH domain
MKRIGPLDKISAAQNQRLGDYLVTWCKDHNMSAHRLCSLMRINSSTMSRVVSNDPAYYPTYRVVQTIANWLNVSVDKIIGDRDDVMTVQNVQTIMLPDEQRGTDLLIHADVSKVLRAILITLEDIRSIMRTTWMDNTRGDNQ